MPMSMEALWVRLIGAACSLARCVFSAITAGPRLHYRSGAGARGSLVRFCLPSLATLRRLSLVPTSMNLGRQLDCGVVDRNFMEMPQLRSQARMCPTHHDPIFAGTSAALMGIL